jgi:hypothetical protein
MNKLRVLLGAVFAAVFVGSAGVPAVAGEPPTPDSCALWERKVLAVTVDGGLSGTMFCLEPSMTAPRWGTTTVIATKGWKDTQAVFWSGEVGGRGVYYRVLSSSPQLYWSQDLENWRPVGATGAAASRGLGPAPQLDWRAFRSFTSPHPGVIYGTDLDGVVHRWAHTGWQSGVDTWGPAQTPVALAKGSLLLGATEEGYLGLDATQSGAVLSDWHTEEFSKGDLRITVPAEIVPEQVVPFTFGKYRTSGFALTRAGRVALLLPENCSPLARKWYVQSEVAGKARLVFAGDYHHIGSGPVEWQCVPS